MLGVSGLDLCLPNCTWIDHYEESLYPIDAGTDRGIRYNVDSFILLFFICIKYENGLGLFSSFSGS